MDARLDTNIDYILFQSESVVDQYTIRLVSHRLPPYVRLTPIDPSTLDVCDLSSWWMNHTPPSFNPSPQELMSSSSFGLLCRLFWLQSSWQWQPSAWSKGETTQWAKLHPSILTNRGRCHRNPSIGSKGWPHSQAQAQALAQRTQKCYLTTCRRCIKMMLHRLEQCHLLCEASLTSEDRSPHIWQFVSVVRLALTRWSKASE